MTAKFCVRIALMSLQLFAPAAAGVYGTVTQKQTAIQFFVSLAMTIAIPAARAAAELYQTTMRIMMMTMNTPIVIPVMNE